jgi:hypothetical protein
VDRHADLSSRPRTGLAAGAAVAALAAGVAVAALAEDGSGADERRTPPVADPAPAPAYPSADTTPPAAAVVSPPRARSRLPVPVPVPVPVPESSVVTEVEEVLGRWRVTTVRGGPVPDGALRALRVYRPQGGRGLGFGYDDGLNARFVEHRLERDGTFTGGSVGGTLVGCIPTYASCTRPSGFGVHGAVQLRVTPDGDLVLVGRGGSSLAVYERVG